MFRPDPDQKLIRNTDHDPTLVESRVPWSKYETESDKTPGSTTLMDPELITNLNNPHHVFIKCYSYLQIIPVHII